MNDNTAWETYDRSFERLTMIEEPHYEQLRAAFEAGRQAGRAELLVNYVTLGETITVLHGAMTPLGSTAVVDYRHEAGL